MKIFLNEYIMTSKRKALLNYYIKRKPNEITSMPAAMWLLAIETCVSANWCVEGLIIITVEPSCGKWLGAKTKCVGGKYLAINGRGGGRLRRRIIVPASASHEMKR